MPQTTDKANYRVMLSSMPMTKAGSLVRLSRLRGDRRRLLARAAFWLTLASAAVAFLPFRSAIRLGLAPIGTRGSAEPEEVAWAIEAAARRLPWRTACIEKGLVAQRMLRAAGVGAMLHYGARHGLAGKLEAHVWVTVDGRPIIGGEEAVGFGPVATYP